MLEDETAPDKIDDDESDYLYEQKKGDGLVDEVEHVLLEKIKAKAKIFPEKLALVI